MCNRKSGQSGKRGTHWHLELFLLSLSFAASQGHVALRIIVQCHVTLSFGKVICRMIVVAEPSSVVCGWILAAPLQIHRARTTCPENLENLRAISFCHPTQSLCLLLVLFFFCLIVSCRCCLMNLLATDPFFAFILVLHRVNHLRLLRLRKITMR